ncbi:MAG TPA: response regulator transcription factor [Ktedonobacterales bacterium]|nr:response regulator transcription factor [Ktedonobacterales bacterium]
MARILIVEDEIALSNILRADLEAEGHTVSQAFDGPSAIVLVESQQPQLVILDWMLPGLDGLAVCRRIRQKHLMPILMLTARASEVDRVLGLEVGADDYVVKPFSTQELLARVRAMLRRIAFDARSALPYPGTGSAPPSQGNIIHGSLRVDSVARSAALDGATLDLTPKEFDLLLLFVTYPNRAFSRSFLLSQLWTDDFDRIDRVVDAHITRLRKKLGPVGDHIVTVWSVGYRFEP